jgi:hypothetical protein
VNVRRYSNKSYVVALLGVRRHYEWGDRNDERGETADLEDRVAVALTTAVHEDWDKSTH